jgi:hypothetical protein
VLVLAQAIGAVGFTAGLSTASLLARDISGSESLAGLVQTAQVLGAAAASFLLARLMARRGRRVGQVTGLLLGASGAALAVVAGIIGSVALLTVGALVLGRPQQPMPPPATRRPTWRLPRPAREPCRRWSGPRPWVPSSGRTCPASPVT